MRRDIKPVARAIGIHKNIGWHSRAPGARSQHERSPRSAVDSDLTMASSAQLGYTVGGGVGYRIRRKVSIFFEPDYYLLRDERLRSGGGLDTVVLHGSGSALRIGANYYF
jgi:opacity protein-like surface antigen